MHNKASFGILIVFLLGLLVFPSVAVAIDYDDSLDITVTLGDCFYIDTDPNTLIWVANDTYYQHYINEYTVSKSVTLNLRANVGWDLYIQGTSEDWVTDPSGVKVVGDIEWKDGEPDDPYYPVLFEEDALVTQNPNPKTEGTGPSVLIRIALDWGTDEPGLYLYQTLLFTISEYTG